MSDIKNPVTNLQSLVRCASVTPAEGGALAALEAMLGPLGFGVERRVFHEEGTADVENLYARLGSEGPHLMFAGHTDVVPPGHLSAWRRDPFAGDVVADELIGRGAVDMKGAIACFAAAVARHLERHGPPAGSISFLITGDEEGPAINGTAKLLDWAAGKGERWDAAIVGEPTNPDALGDMIKVGRRGSLSGKLVVKGVQGHVAYPHLADNPVRGMVRLLDVLMNEPLDGGTECFPASNLEVTSVDVGNTASNVIPARAQAVFNIRFSDAWSVETLQAEIHNRLDRAAEAAPSNSAVDYDLVWTERPSQSFLTRDERLIAMLGDAVRSVTGRTAALSTTGGTSDARFIKDHCPVVEFGLVGQTMHKVDERVPLGDLKTLTLIYGDFLERWFR